MRIRFWLFVSCAAAHFTVYVALDWWLASGGGADAAFYAARLLGAPLTRPVSDLLERSWMPLYNSLLWGFGLERGAALWRHRRGSSRASG